jgi:hypothetical protein
MVRLNIGELQWYIEVNGESNDKTALRKMISTDATPQPEFLVYCAVLSK